jgi:hypothetical protein
MAVGATGKAQEAGQNLKQSNIAEQMGMVNARGAQEEVLPVLTELKRCNMRA